MALTLAVLLPGLTEAYSSDLNMELPVRSVKYDSNTWDPAVGWSEDFRLTNNVLGVNASDMARVASEGSVVHLVFQHRQKDPNYTGLDRDFNILYTRSTDGGRHWSSEGDLSKFVQLNSPVEDIAFGYAEKPTIAVSGSVVHVAWAQNPTGHTNSSRIRYRRSLDSGLTWSNEMIVDTKNRSEEARLLADGESVHLFWVEENLSWSNLFRGRIYYSRSSNGGVAWEPKRELARGSEMGEWPGRACFISKVMNDGRRIFLLYGCGDPVDYYYMRSLDNGETWTDGQGNVNQSTFLVAWVPPDYWDATDISVRGNDINVVLWREYFSYKSNISWDQILLIASNDLGATWSSPTLLVDHSDVPISL